MMGGNVMIMSEVEIFDVFGVYVVIVMSVLLVGVE